MQAGLSVASRILWTLILLWSLYVAYDWTAFYYVQVVLPRSGLDFSAPQITQLAVQALVHVVVPVCVALAFDRAALGR